MSSEAAVSLQSVHDASFDVRPLADVAGAEVLGLDLAQPLDETVRGEILAAFLEHHVLVFRGQRLSGEDQLAFTTRFGELEEHVGRLHDGRKPPLLHVVSNLDPDGRPTAKPHTSGNYHWHTDKSYHEVPSLATLLYAAELPPAGGDTLFANMHLAWEALPEERRRGLRGLRVVHSWEASRRNTGNRPATDEERRERPPVVHPLVRVHPETGRESIYLGCHTSHIVGMGEAEGKARLDELLAFATASRFVYRHEWQEGDLVMWDNRCLLHRADANYDMSRIRRVLHRTVVKGKPPIPAAPAA